MDNKTIIISKTSIILALLECKKIYFYEYSLSFYELNCAIELLKLKLENENFNVQFVDDVDKKHLDLSDEIKLKNTNKFYNLKDHSIFKFVNLELLLEVKQSIIDDARKYQSVQMPSLQIPNSIKIPDLSLPTGDISDERIREIHNSIRKAEELIRKEMGENYPNSSNDGKTFKKTRLF